MAGPKVLKRDDALSSPLVPPPSTIRQRATSVVAAALVVALAAAACSSSEPDRVIVEEGTLPPDATSSTTAGPSTTVSAEELGPPTLDERSAVTTVGIDTVEFGMTVEEAQEAAGTPLVPLQADHDASCYEVRPQEGPPGLTFLVVDGRIERLDVTSGEISTRSGAGIGDPADQIKDLFGDRIDERVTTEGTSELVFVPEDEADAQFRIIFDTEERVVTAFRAGRLPHVDAGCA